MAVILRNREWWSNHPTGQNDILEITTTSANAPRGDTGNMQVISTANWASSGHRMGILFRDYDQDIETFEECMDLHPQLCKPSGPLTER